MPDLDSTTLSLSLFIKLRTLHSYWNRRLAEFLWQHWKLEVNEALALIVAENDPLTNQAAIGAVLNLHPNAMVGLVRGLHKRRLIAVKAHPHDGRKLTITLTPRGLEIVREMRVRHSEILDWALPLDVDERRRLEETATRVLNGDFAHELRPAKT
jgi:DNA-binding MarR family transcriptional regulator